MPPSVVDPLQPDDRASAKAPVHAAQIHEFSVEVDSLRRGREDLHRSGPRIVGVVRPLDRRPSLLSIRGRGDTVEGRCERQIVTRWIRDGQTDELFGTADVALAGAVEAGARLHRAL